MDQKEIHDKGFNMRISNYSSDDYSKIKVGAKTLDDAVLDISATTKAMKSIVKREDIINALAQGNISQLRQYSNIFYKISGIYERLCKYLAYLYKYDYYTIPYVIDDKIKQEKILSECNKVFTFLDNSHLRQLFGNCANMVIKDGCYYGYEIDDPEKIILQDLPPSYCRSRYFKDGFPVVEFNMKYFDDTFTDVNYRLRVLKLFPKEFSKGYVMYKEGKLPLDFAGDTNGWYMLDPNRTVKFNFNGCDCPIFASVIPAIIDLTEAQEVDKKKTLQQLLKIIIQKLPIDKNGELIFDVDEAKDLHNNAVAMLKRAIGVDVLTTFADIDVANMSDRNTVTSVDDLSKMERGVFNQAGVANNLFNTDGNVALDRSIANDEASMRDLIYQFEKFINRIITEKYNKKPKKYYFRTKLLETTTYNYKDLAKQYKELTNIGYSKMLPMVALGHTQSEVLATAKFENDILNLVNVFIPPMSTNTMSADAIATLKDKEDNKGGRPELDDSEKSDKTLANRESMS